MIISDILTLVLEIQLKPRVTANGLTVCLFLVANCALFAQKKLGFTVVVSRVSVSVRVSVRISCHSSVSAASFKDVIDFLCHERR